MIDIRLQNGEPELESVFVLGDTDARFQRAEIALTAKRGAFIYNRSLGADHDAAQGAGELRRKTEQVFNEAVADYDDTRVTVTEAGAHTIVRINVNGESRTEEITRYGEI